MLSLLGDLMTREPLAANVPATMTELVWAVEHEGALTTGDLLDRRTRIGLVPADRAAALPHAQTALDSLS